ncbi:MAG: glycosyltransferase family 2 protein [Planctomycetaceae bacterium]|nr:glycosyltransferase family 2 protein [Planctomycetaceae bacterium]
MSSPLVSTVIPTFNRAAYLGRAIDSVLSQTYPYVEVIVVDDGSTDNTAELMQKEYGDDERVRYLHQTNQGVSVARNTGMNAAKGEFVALLDSDDVWYPRKLELQVGVFNALPDVGMVWTDMEAISADGRSTDSRYLRKMYNAYKWYREDNLFTESYLLTDLLSQTDESIEGVSVYAGDIYSQMIMGNLVHTSTVLMRRERMKAVGLFDPKLRWAGEDYDFHLRTCREGPVALLDLPTIQYQRELEDQITQPHNALNFANAYLETITRMLKQDRDRITLPSSMISAAFSEAYAWIGEAELDSGDMPAARRDLGRSLWHRPKQFHTASLLLFSLTPFGLGNHVRAVMRGVKSGMKSLGSRSSQNVHVGPSGADSPVLQ